MKKGAATRIAAPEAYVPTTTVRLPDGSLLIRPGKLVVTDGRIGTREAARIIGMSRTWVIAQCQCGSFKSAFKPGTRPKSQWKIARAEVLARLPCSEPDVK